LHFEIFKINQNKTQDPPHRLSKISNSESKKTTIQGEEQAKDIIVRQQHRKRMWKKVKEV